MITKNIGPDIIGTFSKNIDHIKNRVTNFTFHICHRKIENLYLHLFHLAKLFFQSYIQNSSESFKNQFKFNV